MSKFLKESQESQEKKKLNKTVQDLKIELEVIKKTQTRGLLEIENLVKESGTTDASINNRIQEMDNLRH